MMSIATNPFDYQPQQLDHIYTHKSKSSNTQIEIAKHLESHESVGRGSHVDTMAHAVSIDIDIFKSPLTQNMIDNWHQSSTSSSWDEYRDNSNALRNLGPATYTVLNAYSNNFNRNIYVPLSYYFSSTQQPYLLKGDANLLLQQFSDAYNYLKTIHIDREYCLQICFRSQHSFQTGFVYLLYHI